MSIEISKKNMNIIKNSASLVTRNAPKITTKMYEILFSEYPQVKPLFADAPADQHMKLADTLSAYAVNIDRLHIFKPALMVIAKRHIETDIKAGHYPMVKYSLMKAMRDTLKHADDDLFNAWENAYDYLADVLISMEKELRSLKIDNS